MPVTFKHDNGAAQLCRAPVRCMENGALHAESGSAACVTGAPSIIGESTASKPADSIAIGTRDNDLSDIAPYPIKLLIR